jgi:hypothetical protein
LEVHLTTDHRDDLEFNLKNENQESLEVLSKTENQDETEREQISPKDNIERNLPILNDGFSHWSNPEYEETSHLIDIEVERAQDIESSRKSETSEPGTIKSSSFKANDSKEEEFEDRILKENQETERFKYSIESKNRLEESSDEDFSEDSDDDIAENIGDETQSESNNTEEEEIVNADFNVQTSCNTTLGNSLESKVGKRQAEAGQISQDQNQQKRSRLDSSDDQADNITNQATISIDKNNTNNNDKINNTNNDKINDINKDNNIDKTKNNDKTSNNTNTNKDKNNDNTNKNNTIDITNNIDNTIDLTKITDHNSFDQINKNNDITNDKTTKNTIDLTNNTNNTSDLTNNTNITDHNSIDQINNDNDITNDNTINLTNDKTTINALNKTNDNTTKTPNVKTLSKIIDNNPTIISKPNTNTLTYENYQIDSEEDADCQICLICHKPVQHRVLYVHHINTVFNDDVGTFVYVCDICGKSFANKKKSCNHVAFYHGATVSKSGNKRKNKLRQQLYKCKVCNKEVKDADKASHHIESCTLHDKAIFYCNICSKDFGKYKECFLHVCKKHLNLTNHQQQPDLTRETSFCVACKKLVPELEILSHHIIKFDFGDKSGTVLFTCGICSQDFFDEEDCQRHLLQTHLTGE